jgi:hypothetical protein
VHWSQLEEEGADSCRGEGKLSAGAVGVTEEGAATPVAAGRRWRKEGNGAAVIWPGTEADGGEQLGWRGTLLLLFSRSLGRMEERPGDGNEGVRGDCSVKERGE